MQIGHRIKKLRTDKDLTQKELASMAKISRSYLADVENNRYNPSLSTLEDIATALNVSTDRLTGASASSVIEDRLEELGMSPADLAEKAEVQLQFLLNLDVIDPDEHDYSLIVKVAKALDLPPGILRAALARQEAPAYDGPRSTAAEDFGGRHSLEKINTLKKHNELTKFLGKDGNRVSLIARANALPEQTQDQLFEALEALVKHHETKNSNK